MMVMALACLFLMAVGAEAERHKRHRRFMANTSARKTLSWLTLGRQVLKESKRRVASCVRALRPVMVTL